MKRPSGAAVAVLAVMAFGGAIAAFHGPAFTASAGLRPMAGQQALSGGAALRGSASGEALRSSSLASGSLSGLLATAIGAAAAVAAVRVVAGRVHLSERNMGYRIKGAPGRPGSPTTWTPKIRWCERFRRRIGLRKKVMGTCARPRAAVFRSKEHLRVTVMDDTIGSGLCLVSVFTKQADIVSQLTEKNIKPHSVEAAEVVGQVLAKRCLEKGITMIAYDRGGFPYEGRVQACAEAARSAGLQF